MPGTNPPRFPGTTVMRITYHYSCKSAEYGTFLDEGAVAQAPSASTANA